MNKPTLSVVIPNYNYADYLPIALGAILAQSYRPNEIIIVDDCSTDNSVEVIEQFAKADPLVRLFRNEQNRGVIHSLNRGLSLASGDYVFFSSADDEILPGFLEKSMSLLARYPEAGLSSTLVLLIDEHGKRLGVYQSPVISRQPSFLTAQESLRALQRHGGSMPGCSTIFKRQPLVEMGGYLPELGPFVDGFTQQVIALQHGVVFIPEALSCFRKVSDSFCATGRRNVEQSLKSVRYMINLMKTQYKEVFPADYVMEQERQAQWFLGWASAGILNDAHAKFQNQFRVALSPANIIDKCVLALLRLMSRLQYWLTGAYLFARKRRITWEMVRRRSRWVFDSASGSKADDSQSKE